MRSLNLDFLILAAVILMGIFLITNFEVIGQAFTFQEAQRTIYLGAATIKNGEIEFNHKDNLGSGILKTNNLGTVISNSKYDPFGTVSNNRIGYTGKASNAGTINLGARDYDPVLQRFTSPDPYLTDSSSSYAYVRNNPLRNTDPTGMKTRDESLPRLKAEMFANTGAYNLFALAQHVVYSGVPYFGFRTDGSEAQDLVSQRYATLGKGFQRIGADLYPQGMNRLAELYGQHVDLIQWAQVDTKQGGGFRIELTEDINVPLVDTGIGTISADISKVVSSTIISRTENGLAIRKDEGNININIPWQLKAGNFFARKYIPPIDKAEYTITVGKRTGGGYETYTTYLFVEDGELSGDMKKDQLIFINDKFEEAEVPSDLADDAYFLVLKAAEDFSSRN